MKKSQDRGLKDKSGRSDDTVRLKAAVLSQPAQDQFSGKTLPEGLFSGEKTGKLPKKTANLVSLRGRKLKMGAN